MIDAAALIARLAAATEGSAALDRSIHYALWCAAYKASEPRDHHLAAKALEFPQDHYTRSLDAALTLVPGGWRVLSLTEESDGQWAVTLQRGETSVSSGDYCHPSATLALVIAALKAKLAS